MGQPGSSILRRSGVFQHWDISQISEKHTAETLSQNRILKEFVKTFLTIGDIDIKHPWESNLWEDDKVTNVFPNFNKYDPNVRACYYRQYAFLEYFKQQHVYHIPRTPFNRLYVFKIWLFRYEEWIIISWLIYRPLTLRQQKRRNATMHISKIFHESSQKYTKMSIARARLILSFVCTSALTISASNKTSPALHIEF